MEHRIELSVATCRPVLDTVRGTLFLIAVLGFSALMASPTTTVEMSLRPWLAVNDGVMGGISRGEVIEIEKGLRFQGELSLENNGGFASVRRPFDDNVENADGIQLRVRGDGRRYQFRMKMNNRFDGVAWRAMFDTDGTWQTIDLMFEDFKPVFRGRLVADAGPLDASRIRQLGFLLADGKPGAFQLDITAIEFLYRQQTVRPGK